MSNTTVATGVHAGVTPRSTSVNRSSTTLAPMKRTGALDTR